MVAGKYWEYEVMGVGEGKRRKGTTAIKHQSGTGRRIGLFFNITGTGRQIKDRLEYPTYSRQTQ